MKIDHIAIWVNDLEIMKGFFIKYFNMDCSDKYENMKKGFSSYFLSFETGARIEIMHHDDISGKHADNVNKLGLAHFAISVENKEKVDQLTNQIRNDGFEITEEPRITGDGFYESVVLDPEGNLIEITE